MSGAPDRWIKNAAGVKDGAACYRTIKGVRWTWYGEDIELYRRAGNIRCRKAPDGQGCFIHPDDDDRAEAAYNAFFPTGAA